MYFCIRDDDTSFFTSPEELEQAYGRVTQLGPVSLAIVPFCRAGSSKGVPLSHRTRWTVHPLHDNDRLVSYLRSRIREGRFEAMLHGYHHDEPGGMYEFVSGHDLRQKVARGKGYLEELLETRVRVFVPPHNAIGSEGLRAVAAAGLHLAGTAGFRSGWRVHSLRSWDVWLRLRLQAYRTGLAAAQILDLGDHREIPGNPVTPSSSMHRNEERFDRAVDVGGVFCAATHYWEFDTPGSRSGMPTVRQQLQRLVDRAVADSRVVWRSVGSIVGD